MRKERKLTFSIRPWDTIPGLGVSPMKIINGVGVVVLVVPAKG